MRSESRPSVAVRRTPQRGRESRMLWIMILRAKSSQGPYFSNMLRGVLRTLLLSVVYCSIQRQCINEFPIMVVPDYPLPIGSSRSTSAYQIGIPGGYVRSQDINAASSPFQWSNTWWSRTTCKQETNIFKASMEYIRIPICSSHRLLLYVHTYVILTPYSPRRTYSILRIIDEVPFEYEPQSWFR